MQVKVNGKDRTLPSEVTVAALLREQGVEPIRVAVEINGELLTRRAFDSTIVKEGDAIEIVTLVGGG